MVVLLLGCGAPAASPVPTLDEPAWLAELVARRPELLVSGEWADQLPAWQALVLRPRYRAELLASPTDTYATLVDREYDPEERAADLAWTRSLQAVHGAFVDTPTVSASYDGQTYVGYDHGARQGARDDLVYKVFFELADIEHSLSAERYAAFVGRLDTVGFRGDSKIDLRPGRARFLYNNVIVHAPSMTMALCAEAAGLSFFEGLEHVARGVDHHPLSWHELLLAGGYPELPPVVRDFVEYHTPMGTLASCPPP